jgi:hypothetical protein
MNPSEGNQIRVALEYIELGIRESRVLMEGAITWVLFTTFAEAKARCQALGKQFLEIYDTMESLTTLMKTCGVTVVFSGIQCYALYFYRNYSFIPPSKTIKCSPT